jgi:hypothetical protein
VAEVLIQAARLRAGENWLYVWGRVEYDDGFGSARFTQFCHRYNMSGAELGLVSEGIPIWNARYHVHGNDAD